MIIGKGLIASAFKEEAEYKKLSNQVLIFASGVSNSTETNPLEFKRESELLEKTILKVERNQKLVYFSTMSVYDPSLHNSMYVEHKRQLEEIIKNSILNHLIIRTSNVVGHGGNRNTLINYFLKNVEEERHINIWRHATRNILGVSHLVKIVLDMVKEDKKGVTDIYYPHTYSALEILHTIAQYINKKPIYSLIDKGADYIPLPSEDLVKYFERNNIVIRLDYLKQVLQEYWPLDNQKLKRPGLFQ